MKVKFLPQDIELEIGENQSILDLAQKNNIFIKSVCNGVPNCAECRVVIKEGEHNLLPPSKKEMALIGTAHFLDRRRLSCQSLCFGDVVVDLSEQVEKESSADTKKRQKMGIKADVSLSHAQSGNLIDQDQNLLQEAAAEADIESTSDTNKSNNNNNREAKPKKNNHRRNRNRNRHRGNRNNKKPRD